MGNSRPGARTSATSPLRGVECAAGPGRGDCGAALVTVLAIIVAVLLLGAALFMLGTGEADLVEYSVDGARAFFLAESGVERARAYLEELAASDPGANPVGMSFSSQPLGEGTYAATIVEEIDVGAWARAFEILSTGEKDGVVRQIRVAALEETFAAYQWFVNQGGWRWFRTGERFEGPVHTNKMLQIDGAPWFGAKVTAAQDLTMQLGSAPVFEAGYELHVDPIELPSFSEVTGTLRDAAAAEGIFEGSFKGEYELQIGRTEPGYLSYRTLDDKEGPGRWIDREIASTNGVAWFGETVHVSGVLDGGLTVVSEDDIWIDDDVLYEDSSPGSGPNPGCDDLLGLIAEGDIVIASTLPDIGDREVHGLMMALGNDIHAEDYQLGPPRGAFILYGGLMVEKSVHLGEYQHEILISGYLRDYHWDQRLQAWAPPLFPKTGNYMVVVWEEVVPPEA
jgi:hypothetical protein